MFHKDKDTLTMQKNILTYASNINSDIESEVKSKPIQYEQQIRNWDSLYYKVVHVITSYKKLTNQCTYLKA